MKKYVIKKSKYPEENKDHIVVLVSYTEHGYNEGRVFKGTKQECTEFKKSKDEEIKNGK